MEREKECCYLEEECCMRECFECGCNDSENDEDAYCDEDDDCDYGGDGCDGGGGFTGSSYRHYEKESKKDEIIEKKEQKLEKEKIELNNKDNIMKMINTQDFIEGYWEENEYTKIVKEKYKNEFELLKGLKDKSIDDKTALTILIIYFIDKEYSDLLMIIKKAKAHIQKITKEKYENIIKEIGLN